MTHNPKHPLASSFQAHAELELLQLILEEPASYPYNPAEPETEAYFAALEQEVLATGWSVDDLSEQGQVLSHRIDQLWSAFAAPVTSIHPDSLSAVLLQRFAVRAPHDLINRISQQAQQLVTQNLSLADQLVQCVQGCLPQWGAEDLQVFARPLAFTMRSSETEVLESTISSVRSVEWVELSDVEQARLSLAIARYALAQLSAAAIPNNDEA
jgi:hypothetical protein